MITPDQFTEISTLLKNETAVVLGNGKEYLVETRLDSLAREEGFGSVGDLIDTVLRRSDPVLNKKVVLALTTNETSFFRDLAPFELLRTTLLPAIMEAKATTRAFSIWSAACSTGQEPYSLAMLMKESFPRLFSWQVRLLASDLHTGVLQRAKDGVYSSLEVNRGLPVKYLVKYFEQQGERFAIKPEIKEQVEFFEHNLIGSWDIPQVDIVFMRNVLIYFDTPTKKAILEKVKAVLSPGGYLFLGTAESPYRLIDGFCKVEGAANVYQIEPGEKASEMPKDSAR